MLWQLYIHSAATVAGAGGSVGFVSSSYTVDVAEAVVVVVVAADDGIS